MMQAWRNWKYKNLTLLIITFSFSFFLGWYKPYHNFIFETGALTALFAGCLFISTFTAPLSAVTLLILAEKFPLPELWILAAIGATVADFALYNYVKDGLGDEIKPIAEDVAEATEDVLKKPAIKDLIGGRPHKDKHYKWLYQAAGVILIFTPLPHDIGIKLLGTGRLKNYQYVLLSALVNVVGLGFIILLSFVIKP